MKKEKLFLHNQELEKNPINQKRTSYYKKVRDHIKKTGYIINPLIVLEKNNKYMVVYGNNRYLAGLEIGIEFFPIKVITENNPETILKAAKDYVKIKI